MEEFRYPAYRTVQAENGKPLLLFSAPAVEIESWAGVPQRGRLNGEETVGFQRERNETRVKELQRFFQEPRNVVQNPLLVALQDASAVEFRPMDDAGVFGELVIQTSDVERAPLVELLRRVAEHLHQRVPELRGRKPSSEHVAKIFDEFAGENNIDNSDGFENDNEDLTADVHLDMDAGGPDASSVLLSEETNIVDFYDELLGRAEVLERLDPKLDPTSILGFTKDAMLAYLRPTVLVDGQHRLGGAVAATKHFAETPEMGLQLLDAHEAGEDPDVASARLLRDRSPRLPVSLLMDDNPSEHVFQFVVVNQKATPMGKALLGTIVSTSLGKDEILPVAKRLEAAGIKLEDSQAVAYLTRADESPFHSLVQTGMSGDDPKHLQWSVLQGIVKIFRELSGGKLYGFSLDYSTMWKRDFLAESRIVSDGDDLDEKFYQWSQPDGPWRQVFIRFFSIIRDRFGDPGDMESFNSWGNTRKTLYNKVSLTILSADYFEYLHTRREAIDTVDDVDRTIDGWLEGVNLTYFNRPWPMENLKKDTAVVREKWAKLWWEYRKNPKAGLPKVNQYKTR